MSNNKKQKIIKGIPSSPGLAMGKAIVIIPEIQDISPKVIENLNVEEEKERFDSALSEVVFEFHLILDKVRNKSRNVYAVIETNLMILTDLVFQEAVKERISNGYTAEGAIINEFDEQTRILQNSRDNLLKDRAQELTQIKERLIAALRKRELHFALYPETIVVSQSVMPTDVVKFKEAGVLGFITETGGISSHSSILARSFEMPVVIGVRKATNLIKNDYDLIIDGYDGKITINPSDSSISIYYTSKKDEEYQKKQLGGLIKLPSQTSDGKKIKLLSNIDFPEDVRKSILNGADGIGLIRTEHMIISKSEFMTEDEQYEWYRQVAEQSYPNPVSFRVLDVGSDKFMEGMPRHEANPALGHRGIRFLINRLDIFKTQIRAILRASADKNIKLMLPMISLLEEVIFSKDLIKECQQELEAEGHSYDRNIPFGIMIETPAAAILSSEIAKYCDFFSIGTNDLTQYVLATDRDNEYVADIYNAFNPAVLKLIKMTIDSARENNIELSICGELASHSASTGLLIGMDVKELSVAPSILLQLKKRVRETSYEKAKLLAESILSCHTSEEIRNKLELS
jgi:phosphoenolpyruvate-protein phosphotransferase (PTS system enzyme I)